MKKFFQIASFCLTLSIILMSFPLAGCSDRSEKKYSLTVNGSEYLYEALEESYKAGEEIMVKTKIVPHENTWAYLDDLPLARAKSTQNDFFTFFFEMPEKDATLNISSSKYFDEDLLVGFHLTFSNQNNNPIEALNHEVTSNEAIADYMYFYRMEENIVIASNDRANIFAERKASNTTTGHGLGIALETTLFYTYELIGAGTSINLVYFNEQTEEVTSRAYIGYKFDNIRGAFATSQKQELTDIRYDEYGREYTKFFNSNIRIKLQYIDYLTGVKVLEFDGENNLIQSTEVLKDEIPDVFVVSNSCEYVVIEEEYTVMEDGERKDETYCERTLINKSVFGGGTGLKFPRGDGLISYQYLSIKWETEIAE